MPRLIFFSCQVKCSICCCIEARGPGFSLYSPIWAMLRKAMVYLIVLMCSSQQGLWQGIYLHMQYRKYWVYIMDCTLCVFGFNCTKRLTSSSQSETVSSKPLSTLLSVQHINNRIIEFLTVEWHGPGIGFFLLAHECLPSFLKQASRKLQDARPDLIEHLLAVQSIDSKAGWFDCGITELGGVTAFIHWFFSVPF